MAKNKTHQRNLERARANRDAGGGSGSGSPGATTSGGMDRNRMIALVLVGLLAVTAFGVALASRDSGADATDPVTSTTTDLTDPTTDPTQPVAAEGPCTPAVAEAPVSTATTYPAAPEMTIDEAATYTATIATTCGDITVELFAEGSPAAVNNFIFLAGEGYYDGAPYHRVIDGFMIQGGDPSGTGSGGAEGFPGYTFDDELEFTAQYHAENGNQYPQGTLAMANAGANTNGSQFFIMDGDYALPPQYVIFGRVLEGQDIVDKISLVAVAGDQAIDPVRIVSVQVTEG